MEKPYYIKENGRFKSVGVFDINREIQDGIWLIKSDNYSTSYKNMMYYMGKCNTNDVAKYASALQNEDLLISAISEALSEPTQINNKLPYLVDISYSEFANRIINHIFKHYELQENKRD